VTPGNPLWFLDLVSLLTQPAPDPTPEPVKVNLIPVSEWKRSAKPPRLRPRSRRRHRRHFARTKGRKLSFSDKQNIFLAVAALLTFFAITTSIASYRHQLALEEDAFRRSRSEPPAQFVQAIRPRPYKENGTVVVHDSDGTPHTLTVWKRVDH
jgi:hypothetical protein